MYGNLVNEINLEETKSKRGTTIYSSPRRVATCTIWKLQTKLLEKHDITISMGKILSLKPFYVTYATEKETMLCMCKTCLNTRLVFQALMKHSKQNNGPRYQSISQYLMGSCACDKNPNGYWSLKCCLGKCIDCMDIIPEELPNLNDTDYISFYNFEVTETPYIEKKTGNRKVSKKCERINHMITTNSAFSRLMNERRNYLQHRFQVENDKYQWKIILNSIPKYGAIFHMDYSENITGTPKFEPQSAHFSKKQFSLHCTVMHDTNELDEPNYKYCYHLSDDTSHD